MDINTSLSIITTSTGHEQLSVKLLFLTGNKSIIMTLDEFNRGYFESVKEKIGPVLQTVISNLIRSRDYLGLQLNFEFGNIDKGEYEQLELDFLKEQAELEPNDLKDDVDMLVRLTGRIYNSEEISTMFNCTVDVAEKALNMLLVEKE